MEPSGLMMMCCGSIGPGFGWYGRKGMSSELQYEVFAQRTVHSLMEARAVISTPVPLKLPTLVHGSYQLMKLSRSS